MHDKFIRKVPPPTFLQSLLTASRSTAKNGQSIYANTAITPWFTSPLNWTNNQANNKLLYSGHELSFFSVCIYLGQAKSG